MVSYTCSEHITSMVILFMHIICREIKPNPSPHSIYPCDYCEQAIGWENKALCCDGWDSWYYKSGISMSSTDFSYLDNHSHLFNCYKCQHLTKAASRFHGYEIETKNHFEPLASQSEFVFTSLGDAPNCIPTCWNSPVGMSPKSSASIHSPIMWGLHLRQPILMDRQNYCIQHKCHWKIPMSPS